jgi:hypothetical protein
MSERYPRIRIPRPRLRDHLAIRESLSICFYMRRTHQEVGASVLKALEVYRHAVGPQALAWYADDQESWSELDAQGWEFIRRDLLEGQFAFVELRDNVEGAGQFQFDYRGRWLDNPADAGRSDLVSVVRFWLSTEYLEEHGPARVQALALALARELPFDSGHAGLCFNPEEWLGMFHDLRRVCLQYPGMDIPDMHGASMDLGTRLRGVHWVNFLGPAVLEELGGVQGLRTRLTSPGITVEPFGAQRACIVLGEWPEAGGTEQGRLLPAYRELARVLEPWLYHRKLPFHDFTEEDTRRWERRFLE